MHGLPTPQGHLANIICLRQISAGRSWGRTELRRARKVLRLFAPQRCWATNRGAQATAVLLKEKPGLLGGRGQVDESEDCFLANTWKSHVVLVGCSRCLLKPRNSLVTRRRGYPETQCSPERKSPGRSWWWADTVVCLDPKSKDNNASSRALSWPLTSNLWSPPYPVLTEAFT